ncbi:SUKH-4 family immunity protein [Rhodopirellula islandica]|uniref:SUKH-4 family immunity protein n=1 Tax=Rhodopirellula islandica TaxID=595434 RepID=UPI001364A8F3|nr:SUKH-4 family immunity protein [Rhodopirellula islandica]
MCDPSVLTPDDYEPLLLTFHDARLVDGVSVIGGDGGGRLELDGDRIISRDPTGQLPTRFVNSSMRQLQSCIDAHRAYADTVRDDDDGAASAVFSDAIFAIDPECFADPENWWAVVVKQTRDGLL